MAEGAILSQKGGRDDKQKRSVHHERGEREAVDFQPVTLMATAITTPYTNIASAIAIKTPLIPSDVAAPSAAEHPHRNPDAA